MTGFGDAPLQPEEESTSLRAKRGEILARILFEKDKVIFGEGRDSTDTFVAESGKIGVLQDRRGKTGAPRRAGKGRRENAGGPKGFDQSGERGIASHTGAC